MLSKFWLGFGHCCYGTGSPPPSSSCYCCCCCTSTKSLLAIWTASSFIIHHKGPLSIGGMPIPDFILGSNREAINVNYGVPFGWWRLPSTNELYTTVSTSPGPNISFIFSSIFVSIPTTWGEDSSSFTADLNPSWFFKSYFLSNHKWL